MNVCDKSLIEGEGCVDIRVAFGDDEIVLQSETTDSLLAGIRLKVESHPRLKGFWRVVDGAAEVGRLPRVSA